LPWLTIAKASSTLSLGTLSPKNTTSGLRIPVPHRGHSGRTNWEERRRGEREKRSGWGREEVREEGDVIEQIGEEGKTGVGGKGEQGEKRVAQLRE
jgi:hypothetical protein